MKTKKSELPPEELFKKASSLLSNSRSGIDSDGYVSH